MAPAGTPALSSMDTASLRTASTPPDTRRDTLRPGSRWSRDDPHEDEDRRHEEAEEHHQRETRRERPSQVVEVGVVDPQRLKDAPDAVVKVKTERDLRTLARDGHLRPGSC